MKNPTWAAIIRALDAIRQNPFLWIPLLLNGLWSGLQRAWKILKAVGQIVLALLVFALLPLVLFVMAIQMWFSVKRPAQTFDALPALKLVALCSIIAVAVGIALWASRRPAIART